MMKVFYLVAALFALLVVAVPVNAGGGWYGKVTGGGEIAAGSVVFSQTVSATGLQDGKGYKGQMQYTRLGQSVADLVVHATVECMGGDDDEVVITGPARAQVDPSNYVKEGDWWVLAIREGGIGSGDRVRVYAAPKTQAQNACIHTETILPGLVTDGNFNIRYDLPLP